MRHGAPGGHQDQLALSWSSELVLEYVCVWVCICVWVWVLVCRQKPASVWVPDIVLGNGLTKMPQI